MPHIEVNGISLFYLEWTPKQTIKNDVIVLLHGLGASAEIWEFQQPLLMEMGYRVVSVDFRGHGRSSKPHTPYSIALFAQDIAELIKKLKLGSVIIIGHSLGGLVTFRIAVDYPELVKSLIIINSFSELKLATPKMKLLYYFRIFVIRFLGLNAWAKILAKSLLPEPGRQKLRDRFMEYNKYNEKIPYLNTLSAITACSVKARLPDIACPALLISADHDYTPVESKVADAGVMQNAKVEVIPNSRHHTLWDQPERLNGAIKRFLER